MEQEAERRRQPQIKQEPESEEEEEEKQEKEEKREEPMEEEEEPEQKPCLKPTLRPISSAPSVSSASGNATPNTPGDESPCGIIIPHENSPDQQQPEDTQQACDRGRHAWLHADNSEDTPRHGQTNTSTEDTDTGWVTGWEGCTDRARCTLEGP